MAKSFDTLGWFARSPKLLLQVGEALFNEKISAPIITSDQFEPLLLQEAWDVLDPDLATLVKAELHNIPFFKKVRSLSIAPHVLGDWANAFRIIQGAEIWQEHGAWAQLHIEEMGSGVKERFIAASHLNPEEIKGALKERDEIKQYLTSILSKNQVLILPTAANLPPLLSSTPTEFDRFRGDSFRLLCIAGLGGLPQINLPLIKIDNIPFGISIIGPTHTDMALLQLACML